MSFSREGYLEGLRDVAPMMLGVAPFATITGVAAVGVGMTPWEAIGMSAIVFAGAAQLAGIALIGDGASWAVVVLTVFMINLRHTMYSASLAPWLRSLRARTRLGLAYLMTDQAYAFSILRYRREAGDFPRRDYYLGVATPLWVLWVTMTAAGALLGTQVPPAWQLDFAIPLTFLALLAPAVRDRPGALAAAVGGVLALVLRDAPYNLGLVTAALAGIAAGTASEAWWRPAVPAGDGGGAGGSGTGGSEERGVGERGGDAAATAVGHGAEERRP